MNAFVFTFSMRHKQIKNKLFKQNRTRLAELMEDGALAIVNANDVLPISADAVPHTSLTTSICPGLNRKRACYFCSRCH